jgi:Prokaryotic E2 family E
MTTWVEGESQLLRSFWPDLEFVTQDNLNWVMKPAYALPEGWTQESVDLAFRIPQNMPAEQPYGFWVRGGLRLAGGGDIGNYVFPSDPVPFSSEPWGRFSWAPVTWTPGTEPGQGAGMVAFVQSFRRRLEELN